MDLAGVIKIILGKPLKFAENKEKNDQPKFNLSTCKARNWFQRMISFEE